MCKEEEWEWEGLESSENESEEEMDSSEDDSPNFKRKRKSELKIKNKICACNFPSCPFKRPSSQTLRDHILSAKDHFEAVQDENSFKCMFKSPLNSICGKLLTSTTKLQVHWKSHWTDAVKPFTCSHGNCGKKFPDAKALRQHLRSHSTAKNISCGWCKQKFKSAHFLKLHQNRPGAKMKLSCAQCSKPYCSKGRYNSHLTFHDKQENPEAYAIHRCTFCGERFSNKNRLSRHITKHTMEKIYKCGACAKSFASSSAMHLHKRTVHNVNIDKDLQCKICYRVSRNKEAAVAHSFFCEEGSQFFVHIGGSKLGRNSLYKCRKCNVKPRNLGHIKRHVLSHHTNLKLYQCSQCPKQFSELWDLNGHFNRSHGEKKLSSCDICGKDVVHLQSHLKIHKSDKLLQKCYFCPKQFTTKASYYLHLNSHTKERHFGCKLCPKLFLSFSKHKSHFLNVHENAVRKFKCEEEGCEKRFKRKHEVAAHIKGFHGNEKFPCEVCGVDFRSKNGLTIHLKSKAHKVGEYKKSNPVRWETLKKFAQPQKDDSKDLIAPIIPAPKFVRKIFKCRQPNCGQIFPTADELRAHINSKEYPCEWCRDKFKTENLANRHQKESSWGKELKCEECDIKFCISIKYKSHMELVHGESQGWNFECYFCSKKSKTRQQFEGHLHIHTTEKAEGCDRCQLRFKCTSALKKHKFRVHNSDDPLKCVKCGKKSQDKAGLKFHSTFCGESKYYKQIENEESQKSFKCLKCPHENKKIHGIMGHVLSAHLNLRFFNCTHCSKSFVCRGDLGKHLKSLDKEQFPCEVCGKFNSTRRTLNFHMAIHDKKRICVKCPWCPKKFLSNQSLHFHMAQHTNERHFSCKYCNRKFLTKDILLRHILKVHETSRNFKCLRSDCGKCFRTKKELKLHTIGVHGEKAFHCQLCNVSFKLKARLRVHKNSNDHIINFEKAVQGLVG